MTQSKNIGLSNVNVINVQESVSIDFLELVIRYYSTGEIM